MNLHDCAFPKLDEEQVMFVRRCTGARFERHEPGDVLLRAGAPDARFIVLVDGEIEIRTPGEDATVIAVLHPGEFTGDVAQLTGGPSLVDVVARTACATLVVSSEDVRDLIQRRPALGDLLLQAFIARRQLLRQSDAFAGVRVIGSRHSRDTFRVRDFLARNRVPFAWLDLESNEDVGELLTHLGVSRSDTPVVAWAGTVLRNPTNGALADALGLRGSLDRSTFDLAVVGAGPAGLAAAVYAASEGLATIVLERTAPGGQAGTSMRIENYLGFPVGLTGGDLAERAVVQAHKFGARLSVSSPAIALTLEQGYPVLRVDGASVAARCLIIATGADYRKLGVEGCERFEGAGVYYAATVNEAQICRGSDVAVVGGGNSAGQAAVFLSGSTRTVHLVVRGGDLHKDMSSYLVERIRGTENIELLLNTVVECMRGDGCLTAVDVVTTTTGQRQTLPLTALFSFIGAVPRTDWLRQEIEIDDHGFIRTGPSVTRRDGDAARRDPFFLETSRRGVFAAGDVRAESIKRVASAVGEGAMAVRFVHEHLGGR
jgi:thioredoxin reductase (NADPH)